LVEKRGSERLEGGSERAVGPEEGEAGGEQAAEKERCRRTKNEGVGGTGCPEVVAGENQLALHADAPTTGNALNERGDDGVHSGRREECGEM
jgi:hypothetical protein